MSVVIDEVIAETGEAPAPVAVAPAPAATAQPEDLDRLDFHQARRRHRLERLWAD